MPESLDEALLELVGYYARTVDPTFEYPVDNLLPEIRVCSVCCAPIEARYHMCFQCHKRKELFGLELADAVVPISYAVRDHEHLQQFYSDLHQYKHDYPSANAQRRLKALLLLFRIHHLPCLETKIGQPVNSVVTVPSGRERKNHPLPEVARMLTVPSSPRSATPLVSAKFVGPTRTGRAEGTNPDDFAFDTRLQGHVLVLEDTWVTGRNAQALAVSARRNGAENVSIVALARMLVYKYPPTKKLVDSWPADSRFDPTICPVPGRCHRPV